MQFYNRNVNANRAAGERRTGRDGMERKWGGWLWRSLWLLWQLAEAFAFCDTTPAGGGQAAPGWQRV